MKRALAGTSRWIRAALSALRAQLRRMQRPPSIGLYIESTRFWMVGTRRGELDWARTGEWHQDQPLQPELLALLRTSPASRKWSRPAVAVALSGEFAPLKRLLGLPATLDARVLAEVISQSQDKFFITHGRRHRVGSVRVNGPGDVWASVYDTGVVRAAMCAAAEAGLTVRVIVPAIAALGEIYAGRTICWRDGRRELSLTYDAAGGIDRIRRATVGELKTATGSDAAHAALLAAPREHTRYELTGEVAAIPLQFWRLPLAAAVLLLSMTAALIGPGWRATIAVHRAERTLGAVERQRSEAAGAREALRRATNALEELQRFDRSRRPVMPLLRAIAEHLPIGAALVSIDLDTTSGRVVAVGPAAGAIINALEKTPGISSVSMIGPIGHEKVHAPLSPGAPPPEASVSERIVVRFARAVTREEAR